MVALAHNGDLGDEVVGHVIFSEGHHNAIQSGGKIIAARLQLDL